MGKKGLSDRVRSKRTEKTKQQINPFEVKVNKVKHAVVNKKLQSWEKGLPGVSRSKAVKKRKNTLLKELHHMKKSNMLLDKRFGEGDSSLTPDEKMVQRFAMEKKKQMVKSNFNLNEEEEVLTHYGQSLAENLKDTIGSDSENEDSGPSMKTGDLQFGGFSKNDSLSWKEKMNEVIADSKKLKFERQAEKEKAVEVTNELDSSWLSVGKSLLPVMSKEKKKRKPSNYMQLFYNLMMEQKSSGASDKLQTEEEKAKIEAEKLQKLEAERLLRMKGISNNVKSNHVSADDLDTGPLLDTPKHVSFAEPSVESGDDDEKLKDDDNEQGEDDKKDEESGDESEDENDDDGDDSSEEEDSGDSFSDLDDEKEEGVENDDEETKEEKIVSVKRKNSDKSSSVRSILKKTEGSKSVEEVKLSSIPYVFAAPASYEELESLLHGHRAEEQALIISRLRKCHHPSLAEGNKEKLEKIHLHLIHYFGELMKKEPVDFKLVNHVTSSVWEMTQMFPEATANTLQKIILEKHGEYVDKAQKKSGRGTFVEIDTLMLLQLTECLFPTSDFRHPVTTPAFHFIAQMLSECSPKTGKDVIKGLFLCSLALKYINLSKRYIPEVVTFLHGLLVLATKGSETDLSVFPPLKADAKSSHLLEVQRQSNSSGTWSLSEMLAKDPVVLDNDEFRCEAVSRCVCLLTEFVMLWEDLPCLSAVLEPLLQPLSLLPRDKYPGKLKESLQLLESKISDCQNNKLKAMQQPSKRPEPLKLFEPKFDEFWSGKRKKGGPNREVNERQRLNHKLKREMKAATREIKRDNEVLAKHQLDLAMQKDAERKRKTKDILNNLANQEGDYKAIKRQKK